MLKTKCLTGSVNKIAASPQPAFKAWNSGRGCRAAAGGGGLSWWGYLMVNFRGAELLVRFVLKEK